MSVRVLGVLHKSGVHSFPHSLLCAKGVVTTTEAQLLNQLNKMAKKKSTSPGSKESPSSYPFAAPQDNPSPVTPPQQPREPAPSQKVPDADLRGLECVPVPIDIAELAMKFLPEPTPGEGNWNPTDVQMMIACRKAYRMLGCAEKVIATA